MYIAIYVLHLNVVFVWVVTGIQWVFEGTAMYFVFRKKSREWDKALQNQLIL
jgi:Na+-driven multidrug efflux pump